MSLTKGSDVAHKAQLVAVLSGPHHYTNGHISVGLSLGVQSGEESANACILCRGRGQYAYSFGLGDDSVLLAMLIHVARQSLQSFLSRSGDWWDDFGSTFRTRHTRYHSEIAA